MPKIYIEGELGCPEAAEVGQVLAGQGASVSTETGNLLMFQQMYQANAKVIQTAQAMFDAILGIG